MSAFFEAVLYIFVFIWTPSLQERASGDAVPLGLVFSCYMTAKMCGTYVNRASHPSILSFFPCVHPPAAVLTLRFATPALARATNIIATTITKTLEHITSFSSPPRPTHAHPTHPTSRVASYAFGPLLDAVGVESALSTVLLVSALAFAAPVWRESYLDTLIAHCAFEFSVGMYWPAVSTLRSECIPEALRSTTMSLFRVPLNLFVVFCLYGIEDLTDVQVYRSCSLAMVFVAVTFHLVLSIPANRARRVAAKVSGFG